MNENLGRSVHMLHRLIFPQQLGIKKQAEKTSADARFLNKKNYLENAIYSISYSYI